MSVTTLPTRRGESITVDGAGKFFRTRDGNRETSPRSGETSDTTHTQSYSESSFRIPPRRSIIQSG